MASRNRIELSGSELVVLPRGLDVAWGFQRRIIVPLASIIGVEIEPRPNHIPTGLRAPGLDIGVKRSGTFYLDRERHYWNTSGSGAALVLILRGERFQRLILSVGDAEEWRSRIAAAVSAARTGPAGA